MMPYHDDFYTYVDDTRSDTLHISKDDGDYIIFHPWLYFGTLFWRIENWPYDDTHIFHKRWIFNTNNDEVRIIKEIFNLSAKYSYLEKVENLFYDSGYWSILKNGNSYMGIGINRFYNTIKKNNTDNYAMCIADPYFIFNISKNVKNSKQIIVDIYAYNESLPFNEIVEPFQKACSTANGKLEKEELVLEHEIRNVWSSSKPINIRPIGFIADEEYKMIPIINNPYKNTKYKDINKLKYLYGTTRGGFIENEYNSDLTFLTLIDIWNLKPIKLINIRFEPSND